MLRIDHIIENTPDGFHEGRIDGRPEDVRKGRVALPVLPRIADQGPPVHSAEAFLQIVGEHGAQAILNREHKWVDRGKLFDLAGIDPMDHLPLLVYGYLLQSLNLNPFANTVAQQSRV